MSRYPVQIRKTIYLQLILWKWGNCKLRQVFICFNFSFNGDKVLVELQFKLMASHKIAWDFSFNSLKSCLSQFIRLEVRKTRDSLVSIQLVDINTSKALHKAKRKTFSNRGAARSPPRSLVSLYRNQFQSRISVRRLWASFFITGAP